MRASAGSNSAATVARELGEVDRLLPQLERAGLQAREVEQVDGELAQALDLLAQLLHEARALLLVEVLVLEQLDEPAEREDRRAQLVGGGGDEALAAPTRAGASWRCMSLKAIVSRPSSSSEGTGIGRENSPAAIASAGALEPDDRAARARGPR